MFPLAFARRLFLVSASFVADTGESAEMVEVADIVDFAESEEIPLPVELRRTLRTTGSVSGGTAAPVLFVVPGVWGNAAESFWRV